MFTIPAWTAAGWRHGFFGRELDVRDLTPPENLESRILETLGFAPGGAVCLLEQEHGVQFVEVGDALPAGIGGGRPKADGWLVHPPVGGLPENLTVFGIRSADCTPVLIRCQRSGLSAALHCGWRSAVQGLLKRVLGRISELQGDLSGVQIAIGPGARKCCYEVGEEVVEQVEWSHRNRCVSIVQGDVGSKIMMGVDELLVAQAEELGVATVDIFRLFLCSICSPDFFSHRREKAAAGRQLSFISR